MSSPLRSCGEAWQRFWHPWGPTLALGLFRIVFAYCLFIEVETTRRKCDFAIVGGFHLPYVSFIQPVSESTFHLLMNLQYPLIVLFALGLLMRPALVGLIALQGYVFFTDALNFRNHPYFFLLLMIVFLVCPANRAVSARSVWSMLRRRRVSVEGLIGPDAPLTFQRLLMVQVSLAYFLAGLHKINVAFLTGDVLEKEMHKTVDDWGPMFEALLGQDWGGWVQTLIQSRPSLIAAALATLVLELIVPVALWFRRTRVAAMCVGLSFHFAIAMLMNISAFSYAMMGSYLLFLEPDTLPSLARRWDARRRRKTASPGVGVADPS